MTRTQRKNRNRRERRRRARLLALAALASMAVACSDALAPTSTDPCAAAIPYARLILTQLDHYGHALHADTIVFRLPRPGCLADSVLVRHDSAYGHRPNDTTTRYWP